MPSSNCASGNPPSTAIASFGPTCGTLKSNRNARRSVVLAKPNSASTSSRTWVWMKSWHGCPMSGTDASVCSDALTW